MFKFKQQIRWVFSITFTLFCLSLLANETKTKEWMMDSLTKVIPKQKGKQKLISMTALIDEHLSARTGKAKEMFSQAEELAKEVKDLTLTSLLNASKVRMLLQEGKFEEASKLADDILSECERTRFVDAALKANSALGRYVKYTLQDYPKAIKLLDKQFIVAERIKSDKMKAKICLEYGNCYYSQGDIVNCEKYFVLSANFYKKTNNMADYAGAIMNCGVVKYQTGFHKESIGYYEKALAAALQNTDTLLIGQCYENIGMSYAAIQDNRALDYYLKAAKLYSVHKDSSSLASLYGNIGSYYESNGNLGEAISYYFKSIILNEKLKNVSGLAVAYINLAEIYDNLKRYPQAFEYLAKAQEVAKKTGNNKMLASTLMAQANIEVDIGELDKAEANFLEAKRMYSELKLEGFVAGAELGLGNVQTKRKKPAEAIKFYEAALAIRIKQENQLAIAGLYSNLGVCYYDLKNYKKALEYYKMAFEIRKTKGNISDEKDTYLTFANLYVAQGDYKNGYEYYKKYSVLHDSLFNSGISKQIAEMQSKYDSEKKNAQIKLLEKDNKIAANDIKRKNTQRNILIGGIGILLLLIGLVFYGYKEKKKSNLLLAEQKLVIEEKHKEITDSINYAKRIQNAMLAGDDHWGSISKEHFILFKPKDVVSGDFYWAHYANDIAIWCTADCTGHGVPGAFMSMIGVAYLSQIIVEGKVDDPAKVLNILREKIIRAMEQKGVAQQRDGMDISICMWNKKTNELKYAGANNSIYIVREKELLEIKPDKMPIGAYTEEMKSFNTKVMTVQTNDRIISFTDGYADQFGGVKGKKLMYKNFKDLLVQSSTMTMQEQKEHLEKNLKEWQGNFEQVDDVCVIGVRV